jgi:hypothetical protein
VAPHQHHVVLAQRLRQVSPLRDVGDEQVGAVAEALGDIPHRHFRADERAGMDHGAQLPGAMPKGRCPACVHDRKHVRPRFIDGAVIKAEVCAPVAADGLPSRSNSRMSG